MVFTVARSATCVMDDWNQAKVLKALVLEQRCANSSSDERKSRRIKLNMSITCIPARAGVLLNVRNVKMTGWKRIVSY